jgi:hypothetical protein
MDYITYQWAPIMIDGCTDGAISPKCSSKIVPIVLSHGLTAGRCLYSMLCQELAAHGYIVFAMDHHDGSCSYTEDSTGKQKFVFDTK